VAVGLVPVSIGLPIRFAGGSPTAAFAAAGVTVIPLAHLMGIATEERGKDMGAGEGKSNRHEGVLPLMLYALTAIGFYSHP
jgi:Ca2+/H+ antiporter